MGDCIEKYDIGRLETTFEDAGNIASVRRRCGG